MYKSFEFMVKDYRVKRGKLQLMSVQTKESMRHVHVPIWDEKLERKASAELSRRLESWP